MALRFAAMRIMQFDKHHKTHHEELDWVKLRLQKLEANNDTILKWKLREVAKILRELRETGPHIADEMTWDEIDDENERNAFIDKALYVIEQ